MVEERVRAPGSTELQTDDSKSEETRVATEALQRQLEQLRATTIRYGSKVEIYYKGDEPGDTLQLRIAESNDQTWADGTTLLSPSTALALAIIGRIKGESATFRPENVESYNTVTIVDVNNSDNPR